jgi:hypothetical protein
MALPYLPCPPATTARNHKSCGVVASGSGQRAGSSPNAAFASTVAATGWVPTLMAIWSGRYQSVGQDPVSAGTDMSDAHTISPVRRIASRSLPDSEGGKA